MAIELTEAAARHVQSMLEKRGSGIGLRLGTRKSGCTGFAYVVEFADEVDQEDLEGTEVDFVKQNVLNSGFEFHNPNVKDSCGCGESFSV